MRRPVAVLGVATLVLAGLAATTPAAATPATSASSEQEAPWIPHHETDSTVPAGAACDFAVLQEVLRDREFYRNVATYADGSPRIQQWKGPLVMRFTNTSTGAAVVRDLSGRATMTYGPDGAFTSITIDDDHSHFGTTLPAGSFPERGKFYVSGKWSTMTVNPDGTRRLDLGPGGTAENLCDALS